MFYVGEEGEPAVEALRLSDAYAGEGDVEVVATVINVCSEKNADLLKECEALSGYVRLVRLVRRNRSRGLPVDAAVNSAVQQCIDEGVLAEYLRRRRSNVVDMFMDEYDEERIGVATTGKRETHPRSGMSPFPGNLYTDAYLRATRHLGRDTTDRSRLA